MNMQKMSRGLNRSFGALNLPFKRTFKCYPVSMLPDNEGEDLEKSGKIIMPPSVLVQLQRFDIEYPILFKLKNVKEKRITHAGVLQFDADEGNIYCPSWMMRTLLLNEGDFIHVEKVSLPVATYTKFQPKSMEFLDIINPKEVLQNALRNFACLTTGDSIAIIYNQSVYELYVLETKPTNAVSITGSDMFVNFAEPIGYTEPNVPNAAAAFFGRGFRLDGQMAEFNWRPVQAFPSYKMGALKPNRHSYPISDGQKAKKKKYEDENEDFGSKGNTLRKRCKTE